MNSNKELVNAILITGVIAFTIGHFAISGNTSNIYKVIEDYDSVKIVQRNTQVYYVTEDKTVNITDW